MSIELLQVMSAFYARSAFKFIELLPWLLLSFGEQFEVRVVPVALSMIVRWSRKNPAYHSQLERLKRWKACRKRTDRKTETPGNQDRETETLVREHYYFYPARKTETLEGLQ